MFARTVLLFFFGTTLVSSQFVPKLTSKPGGCPPAPELAPMICQFLQDSAHLQYKPQLIAPTTYIPPLVVEECDTPQLQINLPLPLEKKPVVIPQPPTLPPIKLPKFPVPVIIEKPVLPPVPIESAVISEMPLVDIPVPPELPPRELPALPQIVERPVVKEPILIPQPPALPAFVMPDLPVRVPEPLMVIEPCPEDQAIQVVPVPYVQSLEPIPAAPEFPPTRLPELPVRVEVPFQPIFQSLIIETPAEESYPTGEIVETKPLAPIPATPELPPARLPEYPVNVEFPALPVIVERPSLEESFVANEIMVTQPLAPIPATPELPPARLPEYSVNVGFPALPVIVERPSVEESFIANETMVTQPLAPIPAAPELPPTRLPELPVRVEIPTQPIIPPAIVERPLDETCVTGEIVLSQQVAHLPAPPELPPTHLPEFPVHVEMPTHPILPPIIIERPAEEPCIGEIMVPQPQPIPIPHPQPPKLPQFIMPEPHKVEVMKPMLMPILPAYPKAKIMAEPCEPILNMAQFSPYFANYLPSRVAIHSKKLKEYVVPYVRLI